MGAHPAVPPHAAPVRLPRRQLPLLLLLLRGVHARLLCRAAGVGGRQGGHLAEQHVCPRPPVARLRALPARRRLRRGAARLGGHSCGGEYRGRQDSLRIQGIPPIIQIIHVF